MARVRDLFPTRLYETELADEPGFAALHTDLLGAAAMLAREDRAGRAWSRANGYPGYTSYASLDDLTRRATAFARLERRIAPHVQAFGKALGFDLGRRGRLTLDGLWVSVLRRGGGHGGHIHPLGVISGTCWIAAPPGSGALRLEDPRLPMMMAAPPRAGRPFVDIAPEAGKLVMWESWLRHEVRPGASGRTSLSFNYAWR